LPDSSGKQKAHNEGRSPHIPNTSLGNLSPIFSFRTNQKL